MSTLSPKPLATWLLGALVAAVIFVLSFIVGLGIAADPGNMDTGMVVVVLIPIYALTAGALGLGSRPALRLLTPIHERPSSPAGWIAPLALAATTALGAFLALYYPVKTIAAHSSTGWYLLAVAAAPLLVALPAALGIAVFRWAGNSLTGRSSPGAVRYGLVGAAAGLVAHYPLLILCAAIAIQIGHASGDNTNVDSFVAGILCWPLVAGPSFLLGILGARLGKQSTTTPGDRHLLPLASAALAGLAGPLLYLLPLTIAVLEDWRL